MRARLLRLQRRLRRLPADRRAATAVEYGLVVTLIVIAMIAALQAMAGQTITVWNNVATRVANATGY